MKIWHCVLCLVLAGAEMVSAAGLVISDEATWDDTRGSLNTDLTMGPRHRPHVFAPLELRVQQTEVEILDQVAETTVMQEFQNASARPVEGTFVLPLPKGSVLQKLTLEIDGKPVEAELLAADKARRIYEDIVRKLKDPALLEFCGQDLYRVRIFPIPPRSSRIIRVSYTEVLTSEEGLVRYQCPLRASRFSANTVPTVSVRIKLKTRKPLKTLYSPSHELEIRRTGDRSATIGLEIHQANPDQDLQLAFSSEREKIGLQVLCHRVPGEDGFFLLLASPGLPQEASGVVAKDITFVLDTSGSMAGRKLDQAKKALRFCVENLNQQDRFQIIRFSTDAEPLFDGLVPVNERNQGRAERFLDRLKPIGGTAINDALLEALRVDADEDRPHAIVFLTDGRPTTGETQEDTIVANVKRRSGGQFRVFCFGIGQDVNTHLLDRITEATRAYSQYVLPEEDLELKVSSFFAKIKDPVLTYPSLDLGPSVRARQLYPRPLPDLFGGQQLVVVGRYRGDGRVPVTLEGTVQGEKTSFTRSARFPGSSPKNAFIPRLWATRRVGYLLDEMRLSGDSDELKEEVIVLSRRYGIVTPYTAYLIVEDEQQREVPTFTRSLRRFQEDTEARTMVGDSLDTSMVQRYGLAPVAQSRSTLALKQASAPSAAVARGAQEAQRSVNAAQPSSVRSRYAVAGRPDVASGRSKIAQRVSGYTDDVRHVGGKTFYLNEDRWVDVVLQASTVLPRERVEYATAAYFQLAGKDDRVRAWLALGPEITFVWQGRIYEIDVANRDAK